MSFTDQVVLNNFANSVGEAIQDVGGDISSVQHLCDYPRIIREQLLASGVDVQLEEGDGITITKNGTSYIISANSNATIVDGLGIYDHTIPVGTSIQNTFKAIFENILPTLPSVLSGDLITSTSDGTNQYQHPNGDPDIIRVKKNLTPDTLYLRLFVNSQEEPIYISFAQLNTGSAQDAPSDGNLYGRKDGQWEKIDEGGKTTATLSPTYPTDQDIPAGTSIQNVFEKLFDIILPALPSILKGDIILSSKEGTDQYQHPKYPTTNEKTGLDPETFYIRIFINSQEEPVYISCEPLKQQSGGGAIGDYNGSDGENIKIDVDNVKRTISATLKSISPDLILSDDKLSEADAGNLFDEIFK